MGCQVASTWEQVVTRADVDAVIVATTHDWLASIATEGLRNGKHVLVEKPMARTPAEAEAVLQAATGSLVVKVGFNHRHHAAVWRARELFEQGAIGRLLFIRCRYGHGGRPGYEQEWRLDPQKSGGGELLDQGIHALDLCRWLLGDFSEVSSFIGTYVWTTAEQATVHGNQAPSAGGVEDNAFVLLRTVKGQVASLHVSWTQWKNLFSFEIFGQEGYLIIEGLGGSYGAEQLKVGLRNMQGGPAREEILNFPERDVSWEAEWEEFSAAIQEGRQPLANGHDGYQALKAIHSAYEAARTGTVVRI
jgi:predicted dehydrogenase